MQLIVVGGKILTVHFALYCACQVCDGVFHTRRFAGITHGLLVAGCCISRCKLK